MTALIQMHVRAMRSIAVGPDHSHEKLAARTMHRAPESFLFFRPISTAFELRLRAV